MKDRDDMKYESVPQKIDSLYNKELRAEVFEQLFKDLHLCGLDTSVIKTDSLENFWLTFFDFAGDLIFNKPSVFRDLCYRIDLAEKKVTDNYFPTKPRETILRLASLIILREIQKVGHRRENRS